ncbi:hypothetical protein EON82_11345 [bacterium]|nr:MAG: hypothetical protein EON82_11345 [bacterium]
MTEGIDEAKGRLDWAKRQIDRFTEDCEAYERSRPVEVVRSKSRSAAGVELSLKMKVVKPLSHDLRFMFGECVHHLRSTLDGLVVALAKQEAITKANGSPIEENRLGFPVYESSVVAFNNFGKNYAFPRPILDFLEGLQPYHPETGINNLPSTGKNHPLWMLNRLWNEDKHKMPLRVVGLQGETEILVGGAISFAWNGYDPGRHTFEGNMIDGRPTPDFYTESMSSDNTISNGVEFGKIVMTKNPDDRWFVFRVGAQVSLDKFSAVAPGQPAAPLLAHLHPYVNDRVLAGIEPFFR